MSQSNITFESFRNTDEFGTLHNIQRVEMSRFVRDMLYASVHHLMNNFAFLEGIDKADGLCEEYALDRDRLEKRGLGF